MNKNIDEKSMINKYINEVQSALPFSCPGRRKFIINLKQELQDISTDNKICDYTTLCELVGSPLAVCDNYISSISSNKIKRNKTFSNLRLCNINGRLRRTRDVHRIQRYRQRRRSNAKERKRDKELCATKGTQGRKGRPINKFAYNIWADRKEDECARHHHRKHTESR